MKLLDVARFRLGRAFERAREFMKEQTGVEPDTLIFGEQAARFRGLPGAGVYRLSEDGRTFTKVDELAVVQRDDL